jgi:transposase
LSVIGAVTWRGQLFFHDQKGGFDHFDVARFVQRLLRQLGGKLLLIWDRGRIHRGVALRALQRVERRRLKIVQLPPYAPDINPQEGIWHLVKDVEMKNLCCSSLRELHRELRLAQVRLRRKFWQILACFDHAGCKL